MVGMRANTLIRATGLVKKFLYKLADETFNVIKRAKGMVLKRWSD